MKAVDIRKKGEDELLKMLGELQENVRSLKFKIASKEVKNHQQLSQTKKDIARVLTILKERHATKQA